MPPNRKSPDRTLRFAAFHLGLFCLPISHEKDARPILVKLVATFVVMQLGSCLPRLRGTLKTDFLMTRLILLCFSF